MKLSHEVLLALAYVSQISDPDSVRTRFIESLNGLDDAFTFEFVDQLPPGVSEYRVLPIATLRSAFGYAIMEENPEVGEAERAVFRSAFQFLAVILENRMQAQALESINVSLLKEINQEKSILRTVLDTLPVGVWVTDEKGTILMGNTTGEKIWAGDRYDGIVHYGEFKAWRSDTGKRIELEEWAVARAILTGETFINQEIDIECLDGTHKMILNSAAPLLDDERRVFGAVGVYQDITERNRAEEALWQSREILRAVFDNIPVRVFWKDRDLKYLGCNLAFARDAGYEKPEDLAGKDDFAMGWREQAERYRRDDRQVIEDGEPRLLVEEPQTTPSGEMIHLLTNKVPLRNAQGAVIGVLGTYMDVTERKRVEAHIKALSLRHEAMLDAVPEIIMEVDTNKIYTWANAAGLEFFGKDVFGKEAAFFFEGEQDTYSVVQPVFMGHDDIIYVESWQRRKDGEKRLLAWWCRALKDERGQGTGALSSARDITESKRVEEALQKSEERFLLAMKASNDGLFDWNLETNDIYYSPGWKNILGYEDHEIPNDFSIWESLTDPEDVKRSWKMQQELVSKKRDRFELEFKMKHKDGHWVDILSRAEAIFNDSGKAVRIVGTHVDITERKTAELELRESEKKFRNFTEHSFVGFYIIQDGLFRYVNPRFAEIFGYTVDECLDDMHFRQLVHSEDLSMVQEQVRKRVAGEKDVVQYTFRGIKKTAEIIHVAIYGSSLIYKGRPSAIGTMLDITKELEMEKRVAQAQKIESIGSLAGGIAHDLNNILFPISGLSEMLLDDIPPETPEHKNIEQIHKSAKRGSDLVKQILAFSRQSNPQKLPIRIQPILKEAITLSRAAIPMNIEMTSHITSDCGMVSADPTQIHQIAMNLITNAYHAVEQTGGTIDLELKETEFGKHDLRDITIQSGKYACITVSDTGAGIDPALIDKIFDPYFTTKEQGKGTGLGLSVVHGIVKEHGGDVRVSSEVGKGTSFHVYLPLLEDSKDSRTAAVIRKYPTGCESILLVDDEEPIIRLEQMMLERLGYKVTTRTSSPDALDAFRANPSKYDLVISDRGMPNMTGEQLARELISIRPEMPIILCTGFSDENDERRARDMGVKGFLKKPVVAADLAEMVRKVLDDVKSTAS